MESGALVPVHPLLHLLFFPLDFFPSLSSSLNTRVKDVLDIPLYNISSYSILYTTNKLILLFFFGLTSLNMITFQSQPVCSKLHDFIVTCSCSVLHCVYIPHLHNPFICCWHLGWFHILATVLVQQWIMVSMSFWENIYVLEVDVQEWDCWVR